jgi:hypothetical protein
MGGEERYLRGAFCDDITFFGDLCEVGLFGDVLAGVEAEEVKGKRREKRRTFPLLE